jgi:hypothetical protein
MLNVPKTIFVVVGPDAWGCASRKRGANERAPVLVLPPDRSASDYRWPIGNSEIIVIDTGESALSIERLAHRLLSNGSRLVYTIHRDGSSTVYRH